MPLPADLRVAFLGLDTASAGRDRSTSVLSDSCSVNSFARSEKACSVGTLLGDRAGWMSSSSFRKWQKGLLAIKACRHRHWLRQNFHTQHDVEDFKAAKSKSERLL